MSLLSANELLEIRGAIKLVTDTFFITPILYELSTAKLSRFNEDGDDFAFVNHTLNGFVEYQQSGGSDWNANGVVDKMKIKVSLNLDDLIVLNLFDENLFRLKFVPERDYMTVNDRRYKVKDISFDGALERKNVLVLITGEQLIESM